MEQEFNEKVNDYMKKVKRTSIFIQRIPEDVKTEFMELAKNEFEFDYGFTLKWLIDFRKGLLTSPNEEINAKIELLADELNKLKEEIKSIKEKPKEEKELVTASGRKIRIGG